MTKRRSLEPDEHLGAGDMLVDVSEALIVIAFAIRGEKHGSRIDNLLTALSRFRLYMSGVVREEDGETELTSGVPSKDVYWNWAKKPTPMIKLSCEDARKVLAERGRRVKQREGIE